MSGFCSWARTVCGLSVSPIHDGEMRQPNLDFPAVLVLQRAKNGAAEVVPFGGVQVYAVDGTTLTDLDWAIDPLRRHQVLHRKAAFEDSVAQIPSEGLELLEEHIKSVISYSRRHWALRVLEEAKSQSFPSGQPVVVDLDVGYRYRPNHHEVLTFPNVPVVEVPPTIFTSMSKLNHLLAQLPVSAQERALAAVGAHTPPSVELDLS